MARSANSGNTGGPLGEPASRHYELTNHLGNVPITFSETITDYDDSEGNLLFSAPEIRSHQDYTAFGLEWHRTPGPAGEATYRYGFNGKEQDSEGEWGDLTHYDYGFRIYNPAIARFLSVDPLSPEYPWYTPYQFAGNMPIWAIDLDGLEPVFVHGTWSGPDTWKPEFMVQMAEATGWGSDVPLYLQKWSGDNKTSARSYAAGELYDFLNSDENPVRHLKHTTFVAHSHGGNVVKEAADMLISDGWRVDIINIATPQRKDFQLLNSEQNSGVYLNFYNNADLVQYMGTNDAFIYTHLINAIWWLPDNKGGERKFETIPGLPSFGGSRIDPVADANFQVGTGSLRNWLTGSAGHSLHEKAESAAFIIKATKEFFQHVKDSETETDTND